MNRLGKEMAPMTDRLARVQWAMGQTLLPEHLSAQEDSLSSEASLRFRVMGLPAFGIVHCQWIDSLLAEGVLSLQTLRLLTPQGLLVDVPGNASVTPFNLNVRGASRVPVYIHLMGEESSQKAGPPESGWSTESGTLVARRQWRLVLSSEQGFTGALETLKLSEFEKDPQEIWRCAKDYVPPLMQMGTSPFLRDELEGLVPLLDVLRRKIAQDIAASYLSGESMFEAKQCLKALLHAQRLLLDIQGQVHIHPYHVLEELKRFYIEVCFYRETNPDHAVDPYDHEQLALCFSRILESLRQQINLFAKKSPYLPFEMKEGIHRLSLPPEVREAREVYLLVQKEHVNATLTVGSLKMAALSRMAVVHQLALQGIPLRQLERPPFQHRFGPEVDFYLVVEGEEWDHALRELAVGFYDAPAYRGTRFYHYWRVT
jgi:type VI secretion system protein ImpJ